MAHFKKGMVVHRRSRDGRIDTSTRYKLRSCGKKQAVAEQMRQNENGEWEVAYSRGWTHYVTPPEEARRRYTDRGQDIPAYVNTDWNQIFALAGTDGWDPEEN